MCGRYYRQSDKQLIAEAFHAGNDISSLAMPSADYNIAPSTFQPVIRESRDREPFCFVVCRRSHEANLNAGVRPPDGFRRFSST